MWDFHRNVFSPRNNGRVPILPYLGKMVTIPDSLVNLEWNDIHFVAPASGNSISGEDMMAGLLFSPKTKTNFHIYKDSKGDIITPIMGESMERFLDSCPEEKPFCLSVSFSAPHGSISGSMVPEEGGGDKRMTRPANEYIRLQDHPVYGGLYRDSNIDIPKECGTDTDSHIPTDVLR